MRRAGTTGTPALSKRVRRASVPAVPEGIISFAPPYWAK
jgi:hypothetical protein